MESVIRYVSDNSLICIALLASIVIPFITSLLNRIDNRRNQKRKFIHKVVSKAFKDYIDSVSGILAEVEGCTVANFYSSHYSAYYYAPGEARKLMSEIFSNVAEKAVATVDTKSETFNKLSKISEILARHVSSLEASL